MGICTYEYNDECLYIPIHLNTILYYNNDKTQNAGCFIKNHVEKELKEIIENTITIDKYLKDPVHIEFAKDLVKKGICFVVIDKESKLRFYPSRFLGYRNNNYIEHISNDEKDGKETNPAITKIIGYKPESVEDLENEYSRYCEELGFTANKSGAFGVKRKYWKL